MACNMAKIIHEHNSGAVSLFSAMKFANPQWHLRYEKPPNAIHSGVVKYCKEKGYFK